MRGAQSHICDRHRTERLLSRIATKLPENSDEIWLEVFQVTLSINDPESDRKAILNEIMPDLPESFMSKALEVAKSSK